MIIVMCLVLILTTIGLIVVVERVTLGIWELSRWIQEKEFSVVAKYTAWVERRRTSARLPKAYVPTKGTGTLSVLHSLQEYRRYLHGEITLQDYQASRVGCEVTPIK